MSGRAPRGLGTLAALTAVLACCWAPSSAAAAAKHRAGKSPQPVLVSLEWVGDIALSSQHGLPPQGVPAALAPVRPLLQDADITVGNLEGTLSVGGISKCGRIGGSNCFAFQAPPIVAGQLHGIGFDVLNQANNHSMDFGQSGRDQTVGALRAAHIAYTGFPGQITVLTVHGVRVAFLGFAPYPYDAELLDIPAAQALVRAARKRASLVVVIIHAGAEGAGALHTPFGSEQYLGEDRGDPRAFSHAVIQAGASIVLGSGPHVVRGIERYRGRLVAYSLGNFVGYHTLGGGGVLSESGILRVTLDTAGRVVAGRWISIALSDGLPRPDPTNAAARLVATLSREDFASDHFDIGPTGIFRGLRAGGK